MSNALEYLSVLSIPFTVKITISFEIPFLNYLFVKSAIMQGAKIADRNTKYWP